MTGACGGSGLQIWPAPRRAGRTDAEGRSGDLDRPVAKWSLLFSYFNFHEQGGPSAGTPERLLTGAPRPDAPCAAASPWPRGKCWCGRWGVGWRRKPRARARRAGNPGAWENTRYLFFGFVNGRQGLGDGAGGACPEDRGPERWPGGPTEGRPPVPSLPLPFQNLIQCFPVGGAQGLEALIRRLLSCPARTDPAPQGLSPVPCPQTAVPLAKEPAHVGERTPAVYSSFWSCQWERLVFISTRTKCRGTGAGREEGSVGARHPGPSLPSSPRTFLVLPDPL